MLSTHFKKILMILVVSSFTTSSFAAWNWNRNVTKCYGNNCHHTVVHKHCKNGYCTVWRHNNSWHR
ncbi:MAG: hypothetical protein QM652_04330 [Legionella sp.]|uniref:hypothetical protein n=1 Tax=Legionella sp. TaxID=459 RepID=UPI0039E2C160